MNINPKFNLTFCDIGDLLGDTRRLIQAGEEVLLAEHILICGVKSYKQNYVGIVSACRQSSHWDNYHKITIKILFEENRRRIISKCTCPADLGEKCKHIFAKLLYIYRVRVDRLEMLSCTDLKQQWGKVKSNADLPQNEVVNLEEFCCMKVEKVEKENDPNSQIFFC